MIPLRQAASVSFLTAAWERVTLDLQGEVITRFPLGAFLAVDGFVVHACRPQTMVLHHGSWWVHGCL